MTGRTSSAMEAALKAYKAAKGTRTVAAIATKYGVSLRGLQYAIKRGY